MEEFSGTPGPWSFDGEYVWADAISGYVADPSTEDMTSGECVPRNRAHKQIVANGRLIAASPELLEVCMRADQQMELAAECVEAGRYDEAILHLRSLSRGRRDAIAKALGN